jgi:hypothetical protein
MTSLLSVFLRAFPRNKEFGSWVLSDWEFFGFFEFWISPERAARGRKEEIWVVFNSRLLNYCPSKKWMGSRSKVW